MKPPEFKPENRLEEALLAASTKTAARSEFYQLLLKSELFLLAPESTEPSRTHKLEAGEVVSFVKLNNAKGQFLPIFTSLKRLQALVEELKKPYGFTVIRGLNLFPMLAKNPPVALLNPGSSCGKEFTASEIRRLGDGSIFEPIIPTASKPGQVLLSQPTNYPSTLVAALSRLFEQHAGVRAAYVVQVQDAGRGGVARLMVGIEVTHDYQTIVDQAAITAQGVSRNGEILNFTHAGAGNSLDSYFRTKTKPFYQAANQNQNKR